MYYDPVDSCLKIGSGVIDITSNGMYFHLLWTVSSGGNNGFPAIAMNNSSGIVYCAVAWENSNGSQITIQAVDSFFAEVQPPPP